MTLRQRMRRMVAVLCYVPFVIIAATRYVISVIRREKRSVDVRRLPKGDLDSLSGRGMTGVLRGTVVTLFANRSDVQSLLPPELTLASNDELPEWLQVRDGHPVIVIMGTNEIGLRKRILGEYRTVPLFRSFLETFVAVPFLRPVDSDQPSPCFHFARVYCESFLPTELGALCGGWPKLQCRMRLRQDGDEQSYDIEREDSGERLLSAQTHLGPSDTVDPQQPSMRRIAEMFSQPLILIKNGKARSIDWNLLLCSATLKSVATELTLHSGFFPSVNQPMAISFPGINDGEFGAFYMETTYLNRGEV